MIFVRSCEVATVIWWQLQVPLELDHKEISINLARYGAPCTIYWVYAPFATISGWWFGTFWFFRYIGNNQPNWLRFFRGVQTRYYIFQKLLVICFVAASNLLQPARSFRFVSWAFPSSVCPGGFFWMMVEANMFGWESNSHLTSLQVKPIHYQSLISCFGFSNCSGKQYISSSIVLD